MSTQSKNKSQNHGQKINWSKVDIDPKLTQLQNNSNYLPSEYCRRIYLPVQEQKEKDFLIGKIRNSISNRKSYFASKNKEKAFKNFDNLDDLNIIADYLKQNGCKAITLDLDSRKPEMKTNGDYAGARKSKLIYEFDEYVGLSDWKMFQNQNLRPKNFEYSKMYPKLNKLLLNTSNDIISLYFSLDRYNMTNFRLYTNDQNEMIENFSCNKELDLKDKVFDLALKHYDQDFIRIYDPITQRYKRKIKLEIKKNTKGFAPGTNNVEKSGFTLENSRYKKSFHASQKIRWINSDVKDRRLTQKIPKNKQFAFANNNDPISEEESIKCSSDDEYRGDLRGSQVAPNHMQNVNVNVTHYLDQEGSYIYYLDDNFYLQIFDERSKKNCLQMNFLDTGSEHSKKYNFN